MNKNQLSLPANRAFVVQLRDDAKPEQGDFRGRVEHMASMEAMRFTSVEELLAFMRGAPECPGAGRDGECSGG